MLHQSLSFSFATARHRQSPAPPSRPFQSCGTLLTNVFQYRTIAISNNAEHGNYTKKQENPDAKLLTNDVFDW